jgi:hypothetical protein
VGITQLYRVTFLSLTLVQIVNLTDNIFIIKQIIQKHTVFNHELHLLFTDCVSF